MIPLMAPSLSNHDSQIGKQIGENQCLTVIKPSKSPKSLPPDEEVQFR